MSFSHFTAINEVFRSSGNIDMAKKPLNYSQLALCNWLFDETTPGLRFLTLYTRSSFSGAAKLNFHHVTKKNADGLLINHRLGDSISISQDQAAKELLDLKIALGGSLSVDYDRLRADKLISYRSPLSDDPYREEFTQRFERLDLDGDALMLTTKQGREWWNAEGKALYEIAHAKRVAKQKDVERTVLIGAWMTITAQLPENLTRLVPKDLKLPTPTRTIFRPFATAVVTNQTEKRVSITDINLLGSWGRYSSDKRYNVKWPIQGYEPNCFVSPEDVMVDYADNMVVDKLNALHSESEDDFDSKASYHMSQIIPLLIQMHNHMDQQAFSVNEMSREIIDAHRGKKEEPGPKL